MGGWLKGLVAGVALTVVALVVVELGFVRFDLPWGVPDVASVETELDTGSSRIASVEPVTLDCRSRVHAVVPVEGVRRHRLLGQVYRTDRIRMEAIGDVDTCVEGARVQVGQRDDGTTEVIVPGESIRFVRPRVDAVATADSVEVAKGRIGKLTDVFPWVDEGSGLVPKGYAYAQWVIGGSACMQAAYRETSEQLIDAYRRQFAAQGFDPDELVVRIDGLPVFGQNDAVDLGSDVEFAASANAVTCEPSTGERAPDRPAR